MIKEITITICEYLRSLDTTETVGILGIIIQGLTLFFAIKIYRNFDVKKEYHKQQYEKVLELVSAINSHYFSVIKRLPTPSYEVSNSEAESLLPEGMADLISHENYDFAIFELKVTLFGLPGFISDQEIKDYIICADSEIEKILPFLTYRNDPLIPRDIAKALFKFRTPVERRVDTKNKKNYLLTNDMDNSQATYCHMVSDNINSCEEMASNTMGLVKSITQWLEQFGAEEINLNHEFR